MSDPDTIAESDIEGSDAPDSEAMRKVHERALRRFDSVAIPQAEMRAQSLADRRFVEIAGGMWEDENWASQYENSPRPEIDKISPQLEKLKTDYVENRLTVDYIPGNKADPETAITLNGMHRADSYFYKSQQAHDNAFDEGTAGGFGAWRLTTDWADPYDPDDDSQRVNPGLVIADADQSVYFDGASKLYDKSDARWAFIISADPREEAEDKWGEDKIAPWPTVGSHYQYDWYTVDIVRTAEYYEVEDKADRLLIFTQEHSGEEQRYFKSEIETDAVADLKAQGWNLTTRSIKRKRVRKYIMNGSCVLKDCGYIAFSAIPIVPFYYRRSFVDNMERWRGYVSKKKDPQRIYNASVGHVVETQSISPYPVPIVADEQMTPTIADEWGRGNIERHAFRRLLPLRNPDGSIATAGPIGMIEPMQVQPATAALLQVMSNDLTENNDTTDQVKANTSADAMDIAAARVDAKSGIVLDNFAQSLAREGELYLDAARTVYFEAGRKVETMTKDDQDGEATLLETYLDPSNVFRIRNDLTQGKFKVVADIQESTATAQQKTVRQSLELAAAFTQAQAPQDALPALYTAAMNMTGEGIEDLQAFYRNRSIAAGATKPTKEEQTQMAQQAAQAQQQPPAPADQALMAQTDKLSADAEDKRAAARLKNAQAEELGGPVKAPEVPSGLQPANDVADVVEKAASARLKDAQADHLQHNMREQTIKTGHQIEMERRQQDHAERQGVA